jgi:hypothetical protein
MDVAKVDLARMVAAERPPVALHKRPRDVEHDERVLVLQKRSKLEVRTQL